MSAGDTLWVCGVCGGRMIETGEVVTCPDCGAWGERWPLDGGVDQREPEHETKWKRRRRLLWYVVIAVALAAWWYAMISWVAPWVGSQV